ncbi:MAG: ATP-binding protein [Janthinobacterium lividum]
MSDDGPQAPDDAPRPAAVALDEIARRAPGVAHDVNNLLTVIAATAAEALARPALDEAAREAFAGIEDATRRAARLVRKLLDGERLQAGIATCRVDATLRATAVRLRRVLGDVAFALAPGAADAVAAIDPEDLDRVVMNLALNARNAMPSGGTLTVGSGERHVSDTTSRFGDPVVPGRYVVVTVRDTGTGMSPAVTARLFEPFFTTRAGQGGTGLGLASVRDLVRQAGGFLEIVSASGQGTTVHVHLPRHDAAPGNPERLAGGDAPPRAEPSGGGVLLLVDDEPALLRLGERALSRAGWRVVAVDSASAAVAAAEDAALVPSAMVADLMLPDGDGLALVDAVRLRLPGLPAVLTSGYATAALRGRAAAAGVAFLPKPFGMAELTDLLAGFLQPRG